MSNFISTTISTDLYLALNPLATRPTAHQHWEPPWPPNKLVHFEPRRPTVRKPILGTILCLKRQTPLTVATVHCDCIGVPYVPLHLMDNCALKNACAT